MILCRLSFFLCYFYWCDLSWWKNMMRCWQWFFYHGDMQFAELTVLHGCITGVLSRCFSRIYLSLLQYSIGWVILVISLLWWIAVLGHFVMLLSWCLHHSSVLWLNITVKWFFEEIYYGDLHHASVYAVISIQWRACFFASWLQWLPVVMFMPVWKSSRCCGSAKFKHGKLTWCVRIAISSVSCYI